LGDDDLLANGSIVDPAGPAFIPGPVGNQPAIAVPATGSWARLLLVLLMLMVGVLMLRRTV
jgi:hypothetical protein